MEARKADIKKNQWYLLEVGASLYHMQNTEFCDNNGLYNLKFLSPDGKYEGVYVNSGGENQGKACTDETDSVNMGTYNYNGRYIYNNMFVPGHIALDVILYEGINIIIEIKERWGNVSPEDYKGKIDIDKYNENQSAIDARSEFLKGWYGR